MVTGLPLFHCQYQSISSTENSQNLKTRSHAILKKTRAVVSIHAQPVYITIITCSYTHIATFLFLFISTGILVGMWPCGIVVLMQELFTAESKSQVYAALHELLSNYPSICQSLSMCCVLCNGACTLYMYVCIF